jgi:MtN3 and saliva related transmembrane protein
MTEALELRRARDFLLSLSGRSALGNFASLGRLPEKGRQAGTVPQAYKIIHSRETAGVSLWMHVTFAIGVALWFALGIMLWNWPMIIANVVTFALTVVIIIVKLYYG